VTQRRRIYLLRHGQVAYFADGKPLHPDDVVLTEEGRRESRVTAEALAGVTFDRVVTSGLSRTVETARIVAPGVEPEFWPELRELEPGRLADLEDAEDAFLRVWRGVVPEERRFLGGETIGSLLDRVLPALERLVADPDWDAALVVVHGGVIRALLSFALTGERSFLGNFEVSPASISVLDVGPKAPSKATPVSGRATAALPPSLAAPDEWIVRAVNVTPYDLAHTRTRLRTMEELWAQYRNT
jgi:broad specificity phosphatase PhoE